MRNYFGQTLTEFLSQVFITKSKKYNPGWTLKIISIDDPNYGFNQLF